MPAVTGQFSFLLNHRPVTVQDASPQTTLLDFVRSRGLTGAKEGCAEGECGACAVLLARELEGRTALLPVNSCLIPLPSVAGGEVYTVEALASDGRLAAVQQAMIDAGGSQCGYCTPGFIVSMFAAQMRPESEALGGNLCRCTGYRPIVAALGAVAANEPEALHERLHAPAPKPSAIAYRAGGGRFSRPASLAECFEFLAGGPEARIVAGNTDLGVLTNLRLHRYPHLISVENVPELREFRDTGASVEIGAALTLTEIEVLWKHPPPAFADWLTLFASPLIRNRATLGGNLMAASPIGDSAPFLLALDAEVRLVSASSERWVPLSQFFTRYRQTAVRDGEIMRSIRIPKPFPSHLRFFKVSKRRLDDISTVSAAFSIHGRDRIRLAFGGMGPTPLRALAAERTFEQHGDWERVAAALSTTLQPIGDHRGSAAYRLAVAESLFTKWAFEVGEQAA